MLGRPVVTDQSAEYVRQLEDACLIFIGELSVQGWLAIKDEMPALADFLTHLHHSMPDEEFMVRRNMWAARNEAPEEPNDR